MPFDLIFTEAFSYSLGGWNYGLVGYSLSKLILTCLLSEYVGLSFCVVTSVQLSAVWIWQSIFHRSFSVPHSVEGLLLVYNGKHFYCLNYNNCLWVKGMRQKVFLCCKVQNKLGTTTNISSSLYCCRGNVDDWHSYWVNNILCILYFNTFKLFTRTIRIR